MKRILVVALPALLAFGIAACDRPNTGTTSTNRSDTTTTDKSPRSTTQSAPTPSAPSGTQTPPATDSTPKDKQ